MSEVLYFATKQTFIKCTWLLSKRLIFRFFSSSVTHCYSLGEM